MYRQLSGLVISSAIAGLVLICPTAADAYVGPGAGLSLLGALWALIAAIGAALAFIVLWPWRRAMRRRAAKKKAATGVVQPSAAPHTARRDTVPETTHETSNVSTH
jgi:membrane protein implicated in regulation of membrane protease activity